MECQHSSYLSVQVPSSWSSLRTGPWSAIIGCVVRDLHLVYMILAFGMQGTHVYALIQALHSLTFMQIHSLICNELNHWLLSSTSNHFYFFSLFILYQPHIQLCSFFTSHVTLFVTTWALSLIQAIPDLQSDYACPNSVQHTPARSPTSQFQTNLGLQCWRFRRTIISTQRPRNELTSLCHLCQQLMYQQRTLAPPALVFQIC